MKSINMMLIAPKSELLKLWSLCLKVKVEGKLSTYGARTSNSLQHVF